MYLDKSQFKVSEEHVLKLDDSNFDEAILDGVVVVDYHATWCYPCKKFGPVFVKVAHEMGDSVTFAKVNVDDAPNTCRKYSISSIPCVILFKNGKEVKRHVGMLSADALRNFVNS